jgi:hypothetical protein
MKNQIKKLAHEMDDQAENINAHDFVMTHRALAILAHATIGPDATLALFAALNQEGGLSYLTGSCGYEPKKGNILKRNKIAEDWGDWEIPDGKLK